MSIVLIGTGVIGTLTALRATIIGTRIENEQSKARLWLQSASGVIERENFADCNDVNSSGAVIQEAYKAAIANGASAPSGFDGRTIEVSVPRVWNGKEFVAFDSQTECYDDVLLRQQLLTITIRDDANNVVQSVELIKRDRP